MNWTQAVATLSGQDRGFVLITVLDVEGSAPREVGAKMVVTADDLFDTIGGGNLEYSAISKARTLLDSGEQAVLTESFSLGRDLEQCCGGHVELLFECMPPREFHIALFGAGHVGSCLSRILSELPCQVSWMDTRESLVAEKRTQGLPPNIRVRWVSQPEPAVESCPQGTYFLILTHSHELDLQLVEAVISRGDARFCGLIGSRSKAGKFRNRLRKKGFTEPEIETLVCPVGLPEIDGKRPMEVAVSIAAQLIRLRSADRLENSTAPASPVEERGVLHLVGGGTPESEP